MRNLEALQIAKLALLEVRLLLHQNRYTDAAEIAELGNVLPLVEENTVLEHLAYEKLMAYVLKHPDRQQLTHFHRTIFSIPDTQKIRGSNEPNVFADASV